MKYFLLCVATALFFSYSILAAPTKGQRYTRTVSYKGEILVRCSTKSPIVQAFITNDYVDIWGYSSDGRLDIRVKESLYESAGVGSECTVVNNIEDIVRMSENVTRVTSSGVKAEWFEEYHRYEEIIGWYKNLMEDNPELVKYVESIGRSYEGRDQPAVHITATSSEEKPQIYFQCQIHAREWISGATCMYIANQLVEQYRTNQTLLKSVEFIFVPFVNPDGYEYTWNNDRLWRKNRRENDGTLCDGVDLNRNYNDRWAERGSSSNPCSETYHGTRAESEPETQNTANYFKTLGRVVGAIDWHSYSQLILRPYGWTRDNCPDEARLQKLGQDMSNDIRGVNRREYRSIKGIELYATTGTASDWFYTLDANVNNAHRAAGMTYELRPNSNDGSGFVLPPEQIIPQGEEIIPAVKRFAMELAETPLKKPSSQ